MRDICFYARKLAENRIAHDHAPFSTWSHMDHIQALIEDGRARCAYVFEFVFRRSLCTILHGSLPRSVRRTSAPGARCGSVSGITESAADLRKSSRWAATSGGFEDSPF